jgi:hypothetical protein
MDKNEQIKQKITEEEDFIHCPRLGNSLKNLLDKHPDGVDEERIAKVLLMSKEEISKTFEKSLKKIRNYMGI